MRPQNPLRCRKKYYVAAKTHFVAAKSTTWPQKVLRCRKCTTWPQKILRGRKTTSVVAARCTTWAQKGTMWLENALHGCKRYYVAATPTSLLQKVLPGRKTRFVAAEKYYVAAKCTTWPQNARHGRKKYYVAATPTSLPQKILLRGR